MALEHLLQKRSDIWRGGALPAAAAPGLSSGFAALDAELPGGGWPRAALSELLCDGPGAFALLTPALARLSRQAAWLLLVAPPYLPYAPALAERGVDVSRVLLVRPKDRNTALWAAEQGLRSAACSAVLCWAEPKETVVVRRLQLAAEEARCPAFLFRQQAMARQPSPAALRLRVEPNTRGLAVQVLKRRGRPSAAVLQLAVS
jgi:hypothetical protein